VCVCDGWMCGGIRGLMCEAGIGRVVGSRICRK
jgi:hypothetical protein